MGRAAAGLVLLCLGKEGGTRDALHRDAQRPSSPQPLVAGTLRHSPEKACVLHLAQFQSWCTPRRQVYQLCEEGECKAKGLSNAQDQLFIDSLLLF